MVVTDVTICARWEFWILIQSISFLCWIRTVKIQTTFQTTNDISWVLCYTLMRSYFSDSEFWSHFLRKMDGFKEIMCFVVNLVTMGYWDFFFFPSSSKLCFLHLHRSKILHGDQMSEKCQHKVCKTKAIKTATRDHIAWVLRNLVIKCSQKSHCYGSELSREFHVDVFLLFISIVDFRESKT